MAIASLHPGTCRWFNNRCHQLSATTRKAIQNRIRLCNKDPKLLVDRSTDSHHHIQPQ